MQRSVSFKKKTLNEQSSVLMKLQDAIIQDVDGLAARLEELEVLASEAITQSMKSFEVWKTRQRNRKSKFDDTRQQHGQPHSPCPSDAEDEHDGWV